MVNWFWFILMAAGIIFAAISGEVDALNNAIFAAAEDAPHADYRAMWHDLSVDWVNEDSGKDQG